MALYVKNKSGLPIYVAVDAGRPGTGRIVLTFTREPHREQRHVLEQLLTTPILLQIPAYLGPDKLRIFNPDRLVLSEIAADGDGDRIIVIDGLPC